MTRVSEAVSRREQALFVGRHRELAAFRQWLLADTPFPELLSISGPGGVGKTTMIRPLPLEGLSPRESLEYLSRRGIKEPELAGKVAGTAGGNPLALSLATDMVLQFNVRDFTAAPEWHLVVRSLAERLLHDIKDAELREVLEAGVVVHQF